MFFAKTFIDAMLIARKTLRSNHFQGQDPPNQSCTTCISNQGKGCCFPRRHGTGNLFFPEKFHRPSSASRLPAWSYTVLSPFSSIHPWLLVVITGSDARKRNSFRHHKLWFASDQQGSQKAGWRWWCYGSEPDERCWRANNNIFRGFFPRKKLLFCSKIDSLNFLPSQMNWLSHWFLSLFFYFSLTFSVFQTCMKRNSHGFLPLFLLFSQILSLFLVRKKFKSQRRFPLIRYNHF